MKSACVALLLGAVLSRPAVANDDTATLSFSPLAVSNRPAPGGLSLSYFFDGGMLPFFWAPIAGRLAIDTWVEPRSTPLGFGDDEGGLPKSSWEVPSYAVAGLTAGAGIGILAGGDRSRWYHLKGLGQASMTSAFITGGLKTVFARHRPDWTPEDTDDNQRKSFPSGHSTQAFAAATYAILYLRGHVFDAMRGNQKLPWWEAATYFGIGFGATANAAERVIHNRHNFSDVAAGAALGAATSYLMYRFQERRFHDAESSVKNLSIAPSITKETKTLSLSFDW
ncbi:MAG: phosphatase PAP2 family protein [Kofleriaceae bacterium]|nr:phosphatase PAP2 family protein [Kofleriaceae bacterium]